MSGCSSCGCGRSSSSSSKDPYKFFSGSAAIDEGAPSYLGDAGIGGGSGETASSAPLNYPVQRARTFQEFTFVLADRPAEDDQTITIEVYTHAAPRATTGTVLYTLTYTSTSPAKQTVKEAVSVAAGVLLDAKITTDYTDDETFVTGAGTLR